jgi:hypothetical protein
MKVQKKGSKERFKRKVPNKGSKRKVPKDISGTFYEVRRHRPYLAMPDT